MLLKKNKNNCVRFMPKVASEKKVCISKAVFVCVENHLKIEPFSSSNKTVTRNT